MTVTRKLDPKLVLQSRRLSNVYGLINNDFAVRSDETRSFIFFQIHICMIYNCTTFLYALEAKTENVVDGYLMKNKVF